MATQICPNCKKNSVTWYIDEEVSSHTIWYCNLCKFTAYEDESLERNCLHCDSKTEMQLIVKDEKYWWCCKCNKYEFVL